MTQLGLFDSRKLARASDPSTSKRAADRTVNFKAGHEALIYDAICRAENGATMYEISAVTNLTPVQVARRLSDMGERKLIERRADEGGDWQERNRCTIWFKT